MENKINLVENSTVKSISPEELIKLREMEKNKEIRLRVDESTGNIKKLQKLEG
jgi:hypothetical protein